MRNFSPKSTWLEPPKTSVPDTLQKGIGGHTIIGQTLVRRGISNLEEAQAFIDPSLYRPSPPTEMPGLSRAVTRIREAIDQGESILIWGDFDVDGQTSTTLLVEALRDLGAKVVFHIPVRATESHGIKVPFLITAIDEFEPDLLLTCDTGVSEHEAVDYANEMGLDVIITDHHDLPPELPNAFAIINGNLLPKQHALRTLPGVGVAYKLIEELYRQQGRPDDCQQYLDLVALGIVADVADQQGDARYLLQLGLVELRNTQRLGLQRLMENAKITPSELNEENIGFGIGPRLNALGRLDDAAPIVEFLSSDDPVKINITAARLEGLNERRKLLTDQIHQAALDQIDQEPSLLNYAALVLAHPDWHPGVIGIVASRLVERFYRPVILIQMPSDALARGSARSIKGIDINKAIASQKELLARFGGHPMAAGLALEQEHIADFRHGLSRTIKSTLDTKPIEPTLPIDAYLNLNELSLDFVDDLTRLAPFGAGNPALVFATRNLKIIKHIPIGANKAHRRLVVGDSTGQKQNILWWHSKDQVLPEGSFDLAYRLSINTFRGERRLQLLWLDYRQETEPTAKALPKPPAIKIVDHRQEINPLATLKDIQSKWEIQIWAEGIIEPSLETVNRDQITKHKQLVLWTIPPSARVLEKIINTAAPETVYLFDSGSGFNRPESLLKRLAGLVKYAINKNDGSVVLSKLAAATGERVSTMHMGLFWLEAKGYIQIVNRENDMIILRHGDGRKAENLDEINREFNSMFRETIKYKAYFKSANPTNLIR